MENTEEFTAYQWRGVCDAEHHLIPGTLVQDPHPLEPTCEGWEEL
jgi:hypothetical protein